jgi:hypothetical protein
VVGARLGISLVGTRNGIVGLWASANDTLARTTINPTVESCFLSCSTQSPTYTVGGPSFTLGLRLGYNWDL